MLEQLLDKAYDKYFNTLAKLGHVNKESLKQLILLLFVSEVLNTLVLSEEEYRIILNVLECLYGTCLIDYPEYYEHIIATPVLNSVAYIRNTEDSFIRISEDDDVRVALI